MSLLFLALLILNTASSALIPVPLATATPAPLPNAAIAASHTLNARCGTEGPCSFGGTDTTLSASVVTTTILSTTSVPCYTTSYVTDSTTTTSTEYSTEIITSTVSEEGTVYIYHISPTPVIMSSVYQSILQVTGSDTTYWTDASGTAYDSTSLGPTATYSGTTDSTYAQATSSDSWDTTVDAQTPEITTSSGTGTGDAWSHLSSASPIAADDIAGTTTSGPAQATTTADGWATATSAAATGTNGAGATTVDASNAKVNFSAAAPHTSVAWIVMLIAIVVVMFIFANEGGGLIA
ncbi:MAG: hypothetical protein TREMPRED_003592 [Tremellales sp. Tagirdzhanova-0007]|nr:MAG: hypothetical protein TREMPRED_003592 [Tremellales sp. Tagirdzhanova-0007]